MRKALLVVASVLSFGSLADSCASDAPLAGATPTPRPASTVSASVAPSAKPVSLSGSGSKVTDHFTLAPGNYRVTWTAQGNDNFIVDVHGQGTESQNLINEIPPNPANGETLFQAGGGSYFLSIEASTLTWSITFTQF